METKPATINKTLYRAYRGELSKLTFNSKPIINDLSKRATASMSEAETILKAIEDHLRFSVPNMKLPAFYLLDSIVKNVGGMYVDLLHGRLDRIFVDVWKSVDEEVKGKMERTMRTWRHGFEGGPRNLFPEFVLRKIEEDIGRLRARASSATSTSFTPPRAGDGDLLDDLTTMQSYAKKRAHEQQQHAMHQATAAKADAYNAATARVNGSHYSQHSAKRQRAPERAKGVLNQGLLQEVNKIVVKKQVELLRRPNDVMLFNVLNTLKELKAVVAETELSRDKINDIRDQLASLDNGNYFAGNAFEQVQNGASGVATLFPEQQQQQQHMVARPLNGGDAANGGSTTPPYAPPPMQAFRDVTLSSGGVSPGGPAASVGGGDASQLLQNLMSRPDLISSLSKVVPGLSSSLGGLLVPGHQAGTGYNSFAQVEPIPLSNASVTRKREGIHNILYQGEFPRQCSQCGWRTMGGDEGRTRMNGHLDWHFRRNLRTQSEKTRKAPMRGWYVGQAGTWETAALADDGAGSGQKTAEGADSELKKNKENGVGGTVVTAAYSGEELRQMTVAVADYNNEPCAICKEAFERKFNEDDESWVLVNAVSVDGKFYHATCQHPDHS